MRKPILFLYLLLAGGLLQAQFSIPNAIVEEFTGAWCGYCPDGALILEDIADANPERVVPIGVHSGDDMEFPDGQAIATFYTSSYPSAAINRKGAALGRNQWTNEVNTTLQGACAVGVSLDSITWNSSTRELTAMVRGSFTGPVQGDIRIGFMITEDNVTGTGAGYNQVNYFNTTAGHHYQGAGDPIVGYVHRHVLRAAVGGPWGVSGIIASPANFGTAFSHTVTYTLPANIDENEVALIGFVANQTGSGTGERRIINGDFAPLIPLITSVGDVLSAEDDFLQIGPNPVVQSTTVSFSVNNTGNIRLQVSDLSGRVVRVIAEGHTVKGIHSQNWAGTDNSGKPLANGTYLMSLIAEDGQAMTKRVVIAR